VIVWSDGRVRAGALELTSELPPGTGALDLGHIPFIIRLNMLLYIEMTDS
jgi:hypothetical protein